MGQPRLPGGRDRARPVAGGRELLRAVKVEAAAEELGLATYPGLRSLSQAAPEPWSSIFARHRQAFLELTSEVRDLSERNRHLLAKGRDAAREALNWLTGKGPPAQAYTSAGRPCRPRRPSSRQRSDLR